MLMANPLRTEMPDPPEMTCQDVERWLIAVFVSFTDAPVFSTRARQVVPVASSEMAAGPLHWLEFASEVLGPKSPELLALLTWARAKARRRIKRHRRLRLLKAVPGGTVTDFCNETGWCRRTFDRRRKRACARIAEAWNEQAPL